ncbi:unnamed protein product [Psylliodes chrysocephalus]|uniref:Sedoheptulokinase n=1 Tax=Psylliodes chrysocephalus TaxID=3402493 RepID=A0A9P0CSF9_9CUCU|nr:unnamed protein product [Psylliodes chrysocephala]
MTRYVLGIDLGTTSIKVSIFNVDTKEVVDQCTQVTNSDVAVEIEGAHEQSVPKIIDVLNSCLEKIKPNFRRIISKIGVCGQMHGVVLWKTENGDKPWKFINNGYQIDEQKVSNLYTWQDGRCNPKFLQSLPEPESHLGISTGFGIPTIFWLKKNTPKQLKKYNRSGLISSFVVAMLCDQDQVYTSYQNAASWGYFTCKDLQWNLRILEKANFPVELLPEVKSSGVFVGTLSQSWYGIPAGIPIGVDLGDLQCSVISTIETLEDAVINVSTSAQVAFVTNNYTPTNGPPTIEPLSFWPYFNNMYVGVAASLNGGNALVFFVDMLEAWFSDLGVNLNKNTLWDTLIRVGINNISDPTLDIKPTCLGERFDPNLTASVTNITGLNLSLGEVFKALCRGLVDNLHSQLSSTTLKKSKCNRLVGTGLALDQNMLLRNEVERVYQLPLVCKRVGDASKGAALALYIYGEPETLKSPKRKISLTNSMNNDLNEVAMTSIANDTTYYSMDGTTYYSMDGTAQFSKPFSEDNDVVITSTPRHSDSARTELPSFSPIARRRTEKLDPDSCSIGTGSLKCDITKPCQCPATCKCNSKNTKNYLIILLSDPDTDISTNNAKYPVDHFSEVSGTLPAHSKDLQIRFSKNKTDGNSQFSSKPNGLTIDSDYYNYYHNSIDDASQFSQSSPPTTNELPILSAKNKTNRYTVESPSFRRHNDLPIELQTFSMDGASQFSRSYSPITSDSPTSRTRSVPFQKEDKLKNVNTQKSKPRSGISSGLSPLPSSAPMKTSPDYKDFGKPHTTSPNPDPASTSTPRRSFGQSSDSVSRPSTLKKNNTNSNSDEDYTKFLLLQKSPRNSELQTESKKYNTFSIDGNSQFSHISTQTTGEFTTTITTPFHFHENKNIRNGKIQEGIVRRSNFPSESAAVKTNDLSSRHTRNLPKTSDVSQGYKKYKYYNSQYQQTTDSQKYSELPNEPKKYKTFSMDDASNFSHISTQTTSDSVTSKMKPFQLSEEDQRDEIQKHKPTSDLSSGISPHSTSAPMKTSDLPRTQTNNIPKSFTKNKTNNLSVDSGKYKYFKNSFDSDYEYSESSPPQKTNDLPTTSKLKTSDKIEYLWTPRQQSAKTVTRSVQISPQDLKRSGARSFPISSSQSTSPEYNNLRQLDKNLFNDNKAPTTDVSSRYYSDSESVTTSTHLKDIYLPSASTKNNTNYHIEEEDSLFISTRSPPTGGEFETNISNRDLDDDYSKFLLLQKSTSPEDSDLSIEPRKYKTFSIDDSSEFSHVSTQTTSNLADSIAPPTHFQEDKLKSSYTKNTTLPKSTQTTKLASGITSYQIPRSRDLPITTNNNGKYTEEGSSKITETENSSTKYKNFSQISLTSSSSQNSDLQISKTIPKKDKTRNDDILEYKETSSPTSNDIPLNSEKYKAYNETAEISIESSNIHEYLPTPTVEPPSVERSAAIKYNLPATNDEISYLPLPPTSASPEKSVPIKQSDSDGKFKSFVNTKPKYLSTATSISDLVPNTPSNLRLATIKNGKPKDSEGSRKTNNLDVSPYQSSAFPLTSKDSDVKGPPTPIMSGILVDTIPTHLIESTLISDLTAINRATSDLSLDDFWESPPTPIMSNILIPTIPNYLSSNAITENKISTFSTIIRPISTLFSTLTSPPTPTEEHDTEKFSTPEILVTPSISENLSATVSGSALGKKSVQTGKTVSTSTLEPTLRTLSRSVSEESVPEQPGTPVISNILVPNIPRYFQSTISVSSSKSARRSAASLPKSDQK